MLSTLLDLGEKACSEIYTLQMDLLGGELP
jgi:hypothetical protein